MEEMPCSRIADIEGIGILIWSITDEEGVWRLGCRASLRGLEIDPAARPRRSIAPRVRRTDADEGAIIGTQAMCEAVEHEIHPPSDDVDQLLVGVQVESIVPPGANSHVPRPV